jgi:hypothetical protein
MVVCGVLRLRFFVVLGLILAVVLSAGFVLFVLLPGLLEARLAADLQGRYELEEEPVVVVYPNFQAELLLGHIDRVEVYIDSHIREGILLRNLRINLDDVNVSILSPVWKGFDLNFQAASLVAEVPEESVNEYLRENELGMEGGKIDVLPQEIIYRPANASVGIPTSVGLDLRVVGPHTVEVVPNEVTVGGFTLPPFLTEPLTPGDRTLDLSELPLGTELVSVESSPENALIVRAEK